MILRPVVRVTPYAEFSLLIFGQKELSGDGEDSSRLSEEEKSGKNRFRKRDCQRVVPKGIVVVGSRFSLGADVEADMHSQLCYDRPSPCRGCLHLSTSLTSII